jgi:hypothetical protein
MTVNTVSSDDVVYVNGKPTFVTKIIKDNRGGRDGREVYRAFPPYTCRAEQLTPPVGFGHPGGLLAFDCDCEGTMLAPM